MTAAAIAAQLRVRHGPFLLDVELAAPERDITAVFGPSGSGKTTLLRCFAGLERGAEGHIEVLGQRWQDSSSGRFVPTHRRGVGWVPQDAALFSHLSVRRNLEFAARRAASGTRRPHRDEVVGWLGIAHLLDRDPGGLSGGERQRVAIARALLAAPRLLLMDEPLASLDEESRRGILPYLERLHRELAAPVLYVSHSRAEVLRLADYLVLLDRGRVRAAGPLAELATRPDLATFGAQDELGTVAEAVVVDVDERFELATLELAGGRVCVPEPDLRRGARRRVRFLARDISLALDAPRRSSILNVLPAQVMEVGEGPGPLCLVRLDAGGTILLSRITRRSRDALRLETGSRVWAQIKSVALLP